MSCKENVCECDEPTREEVAGIEQAIDATFLSLSPNNWIN